MALKVNIPLVRPTLVPWEEVEADFREVWESGQLTVGNHTREFEEAICKVTDAKFAVAVSSCTSGLMLLLRALEITKEVIIPSFTWASTGHALVWNNIVPVFADCLPGIYTLDPEDVARKISPRTQAIFAANVFGVHPDIDALQKVADAAGIPLLCDSAQAIGATYKGRNAGSTCLAEVFSFSPTKVVTAVEGGLITTDDADLADKLRRMRDYGKSSDGKDVELFGMSARISELHSIVGKKNLTRYRELIERRGKIAARYREAFRDIEGMRFQETPAQYESSHNYFVTFHPRRDQLEAHLTDRGIQTKRYFYPPLHKQKSYACLALPDQKLPVTEQACAESLALPFFSHITDEQVSQVIDAVLEFFSKK